MAQCGFKESDFKIRYVLGRADLVSTDNVSIRTLADAERSSGYIKRASIILTPYTSHLSAQQRRAVMIHEIGHVLGLGHPNTVYNPTQTPSIKRSDPLSPLYIIPQPHDVTDLNNFY